MPVRTRYFSISVISEYNKVEIDCINAPESDDDDDIYPTPEPRKSRERLLES